MEREKKQTNKRMVAEIPGANQQWCTVPTGNGVMLLHDNNVQYVYDLAPAFTTSAVGEEIRQTCPCHIDAVSSLGLDLINCLIHSLSFSSFFYIQLSMKSIRPLATIKSVLTQG
jgi:hypothetical protein